MLHPIATLLAFFCLSASLVLAQSGTLDVTYSTDGYANTPHSGFDDEARAVIIQPDGKILAAGYSLEEVSGYDYALLRLNTNGTLDNTFGTGGTTSTEIDFNAEARAMAVQADGSILLAGFSQGGFGTYKTFTVTRYTTTGTLDTGFGVSGIVRSAIGTKHNDASCLAVQPTGRILAAGYSQLDDFRERGTIAGYDANGILDPTFGTDGVVIEQWGLETIITEMILYPDGDILVAGSINYASFVDSLFLARYDQQGVLDTSFGTNGLVKWDNSSNEKRIHDLRLHPNGQILVGGYRAFQTGSSPDADAMVWAFTDMGFFDTAFDGDGEVQHSYNDSQQRMYALAIDDVGRIVLAGATYSGGSTDMVLARLLEGGELDPSFGNGGWAEAPIEVLNNEANAIALQADGKAVVAGWYYNGTYKDFLTARFLMDPSNGIQPLWPSSGTSVHPVPCSDRLTITWPQEELGAHRVRLLAPDGRLLEQWVSHGATSDGSFRTQIDMSGAAPGAYFIEVVADEARSLHRVVKQP